MRILKVVGLGIIASLLIIAALLVAVVVGILGMGDAVDALSRSLAVIGIGVLTILAIGGVSRLISD
jgi:hypothetical protein